MTQKIFTKKNILIILSFIGIFISFLFIIFNLNYDKNDYFKNTLYSIEDVCSKTDEYYESDVQDSYYSTFYYANRCVSEKLTPALSEVDPTAAAKIVFSLYRSPDAPFITSRCHSIVHDIGRSAAERDFTINSSDKSLELCSSAFLHGYYEKSMEMLNEGDFIKSGFDSCASSAMYKGSVQDCAHTYGHLLYSKSSGEFSNRKELVRECLSIKTEAQFTCLNGFFMEMFGDSAYTDMVLVKQFTSNINDIIDICFNYNNTQIKESCVLMSWHTLYAFFEKHKGGVSSQNYVKDSCSYIEPELAHSCGMMLGFMFFNLYSSSPAQISSECSSLKNTSTESADGCFLWAARTLWRQTYVDEDFYALCGNVSTGRQEDCDAMWDYINNTSST